jgi:hypothetical protein
MKISIHCFIISRSVLLRMRNVADKQTKVVEKIETHIMCSVTFSKIVPFMR